MRIWLVTIGEPLPTDGTSERLLRTGMLAEMLAGRGHEVVWWSSTFDHAHKRQRFAQDATISLAANYWLRLIHARSYPRNICPQRWLNHRILAKRFTELAASEPEPDLILSSLPTVELCRAAINYAQPRGIPVAIDVRDLWPEVFVDLAPRWLQGATKVALSPWFAEARAVYRQAQGILGTTSEYIANALRHAHRESRPSDRAFPLGYRHGHCSVAAQQAADSFWDQHGINNTGTDFICCYFGNMGRHCTLETVIHSACNIEERGFRMKFVLCGIGDKLAYYRNLANGCSSVVFPGWIDATQIRALMARSSVGLAPYTSNTNFRNNIPNKPIEYLSAGLPIISSLKGVLQRLIAQHNCGATYVNGNTEQLTTLLLSLANDSNQLQQMSHHALQLFHSQFDADLVYAQMADHLQRLARVCPAANVHIRPRNQSALVSASI